MGPRYEGRTLAGRMVLECRLLASAAVCCHPAVLGDEDLAIVVACCVAFPPAFMESLL